MPELPEVEAARKAVHESCCGRRILQASVANDTIVINSVEPSVLESALVGRSILGAHRKGKNLWLELDSRPWPSFQFGMTGAFSIKGKELTKYKRSAVSDKEEWPSKFSKVFFKLDDGLEVSFTDKRRLARVRLLDDPIAAPPISELGPDAFLELPVETTFISGILKKRCPIKALLMDQSFVAGIGNWIADEVLYQARIHPEQVASSLSETECIRLHKTIQEVLKLSVDVNADSEMFPKDWIFHYRWNKKPGEVGGEKISFITVGGRTSAIVPVLQKCSSQSSRKKTVATDLQVDDDGTENVTANTKKRSSRKKEQSSKAASLQDEEDFAGSQVVEKKKTSTKEALPVSKAESKKGRGSKKSASAEEEKESKLAVVKGKASKVRNQKEKSPESLLNSGKKQGKAPARKRSDKLESTDEARTSIVVNAPSNEQVGNKAVGKRTKKVSWEEAELKVEKGEVSSTLKKNKGQKRKRGVK